MLNAQNEIYVDSSQYIIGVSIRLTTVHPFRLIQRT